MGGSSEPLTLITLITTLPIVISKRYKKKDMDEEIVTVLGLFRDNKIIQPNGKVIPAVTYETLRKEIEFEYGWFNIRKTKGKNCIIQFVPY